MDEFYTRNDVSETEVTLKVTLPLDVVQSSYAKLLEERGQGLDVKGFRKGNVPSDLVEPSMQQLILTETFERLAPYYVNAAVIKEELEPIAPPEYSELGDFSKDKPMAFSVKITVMPKFELGNLSKIKVDTSDPEIKDSEIDETIKMMFENNAANIGDAKKLDKKKNAKPDDNWAHEIAKLYNFQDVKTLADLKSKLKELLLDQKRGILQQTAVADALSQAIKASKIDIPEPGILYEAQQREESFMKDLDNMKMSLKDFLTERNMKHSDIKERWEKDAKEALETDVLLRLYSEKHGIDIEDKELEDEVTKIRQSAKLHYEQEHAGHDHESNFDDSVYDNPQWQAQIKGYLVKQKAYQKMLTDILGEEFFKTPEPVEEPKEKDKKKSEAKKK